MNPKLSVLAVLLAATAVAVAEMRTWKLKSGATLEGEIVAFPGPDTVQMKRSDGKPFTLSVTYLSSSDRAYVQAARAKQWKEVSVDKVLGPAGRYKKCSVSGKDLSGEILVALLPPQAETVLSARQQQEAQIADLTRQIQSNSNAAHDAHAAATSPGTRSYHRANRVQARLATQDEANLKLSLEKLKADYDEGVKKTKAATTLLMRNTGLVSQGLPVWECQAAPKRQ